MLTTEQKEHVTELIEMGDKLEAVRYLQGTLNINADQALLLAEKLQQEIIQAEAAEFESLQRESSNTKSDLNVGRLVGGVFMGLGGIMLIIVVIFLYYQYSFTQRAEPIKAKVIEYRSHRSRNDNGSYTTMFAPVYQYTYKGQTYTYISNSSSSSREFDVNEIVDALIDPKDPTEILIDSFMDKWFVPLLLGFMGSIFGGLGYVVFRVLGKAN